jgi:glycosyltransferase involved in cell wall biosynthesis
VSIAGAERIAQAEEAREQEKREQKPVAVRVGGPHCGLAPVSALGGEVFERMLLSRLPDYGVHLEIGLPASRRLAEIPSGWNVKLIHPGRWLRWYIAPLAFVPYTLRLLRHGSVDLLRGHSILFTGPSLLLARWLARSSTPIVLQHLHSDLEWRRLEGWVLRRADVIFTLSDHSRQQLLDVCVSPNRIHVVMPGVQTPATVEPWEDAWPPNSGLRLLFFSRLVARKRPHVAVEALAELRNRGLEATLVIAGDGPLRESLEARARELGVEDRITWLGAVFERKWGLYDAADVFLFPSLLEGFGFVVAEAQSRGVPVVAARGTATSEIVVDGETGLLVDGDAKSFADAVENLATPRAVAGMRRRAREAVARFDWERAAAETARVLAETAARARR